MSNDSYGAFFYFLCIWSRLSHLHLAIYVRLKNKTPHFYHSHQYRRHYVNENVKFKWWNEWAEKSMILPLQFSIIIQEVESFYYFMKKKKGENLSSIKSGNSKTHSDKIPRYILHACWKLINMYWDSGTPDPQFLHTHPTLQQILQV